MSITDVLGEGPVLIAHAHPDDEVLATGLLLAHLADAGVPVTVVTSTRGERGEVVPGALPEGTDTRELAGIREAECLAALGVVAGEGEIAHAWLGSGLARAGGEPDRVYRDSGMVWVTPMVAGPDGGDDPRTLCGGDPAAQVEDLSAAIAATGARVVVSYDESGGYGHPDHVRTHEIAVAAAREAGTPFVEIVPRRRVVEAGAAGPPAGAVRFDMPELVERTVAALRHYRTQLTVGEDHIEHVGGQQQAIDSAFALRRL